MQFALRLLPNQYSALIYAAELLSEYFSFIESGFPIPNFDYFKLARECKRLVCELGIKATKNCHHYAAVNFTKNGFTKTMVHTMFDEVPNDIAR